MSTFPLSYTNCLRRGSQDPLFSATSQDCKRRRVGVSIDSAVQRVDQIRLSVLTSGMLIPKERPVSPMHHTQRSHKAPRRNDGIKLYTNNLKNRKFDKEALPKLHRRGAAVFIDTAQRAGGTSEEKPTLSKTDSSDCLCINN